MALENNRRFLLRQEIRRTQPYHIGHPLSADKFEHNKLELQTDTWMMVEDPLLRRHMAFMGTSGSGKSKLIESLCRHLIDTQNGFTFIDPHGDTAQAVADYAAKIAREKGDDYILPRFHYLKPSRDWLFSLDPFHSAEESLPENVDPEFAQELDIDNQAQEMADVLLRRFAQQDKEVMRRLSHWLENALVAVSTPNCKGQKLAFSDILAVLDSSDTDLPRILHAINDRLPRKVRHRYDFFQSIKDPLKREQYIESTINNVRAFLKNMPELIFGRQAPSIDFAEAIRNRHCVVVNLRATRQGINERAAMAIADFVIHKVKHACRENDEANRRVPHHLIVDEASIYLAEDLGHFLDQARKWKLSVCLSSQRLGQFDRGDVKVSPTVMAESGLFVSFRQKDLEEVQNLGKFFAYPNYNLKERTSRTQVPDKDFDRLVPITDTSTSKQHVESTGTSAAHTDGKSHVEGSSHSEGISTATGKNRNTGSSVSTNQHYTHVDVGGMQVLMPVSGSGESTFQGSGDSDSTSRSQSHGTIDANSTMEADTTGTMKSESHGESATVTLKNSLVAGTSEKWDPTGQPELAIPYQDAMHERLLTCLPDRIAFLRTKIDGIEQSILFRTPDIVPPIENPEEASRALDEFLERLYKSKDYMFRPTSLDKATARRRKKFLDHGEQSPSSSPPKPMHGKLPEKPDDSPDGF